jgi:hypothetical protein
LQIAKLNCVEDVITYGRNSDGSPDHNFKKGNVYLFCVDEKKGDLFTYDDSKEVHFTGAQHKFTEKHFDVIAVGEANTFGLDEFTLIRMKRLYKERHDFAE